MTRTFALTVSALALMAGSASAQSFSGPPAYGELAMRAGGGSVSAGVRAAGALSAERLSPECRGYISDSPTVAIQFPGGGDLYISAGADEDTTLAVRGPDGTVSCDDDGASGFNPGVQLQNARAGRYEVWLGTFAAGVGYPAATVHASTTGFDTSNPFSRAPNPNLPAELTLSLRAGFSNDPRRVEVSAGGDVRLSGLDESCPGFAGEAPDAALDYRAGSFPLFIALQSEEDAVIAVQTPSGDMLCNDDAVGLDPGVQIASPDTGRYLIWTGLLYPEGLTAPGTLSISEIGYDGVDNSLDLFAQPLSGSRRVSAGFLPDPISVPVFAGGSVDADQAIAGQTIAEGYCAGYVSREPTFELEFEAGDAPLFLSVMSDEDTTLVVNAPDGAWFCDDDGGPGLNPLLEFDPAQSGIYDIYVGAFSSGDASAATLFISEIGGGADPIGGQVDIALPARFGDHSLQGGFLPDPYVIEVEAGGPLDADESGVDSDQDWCAGNISQAPTVELDWAGQPDGRLSIFVESEVDTTLAINLPDGSWRCNDDGGPGLDPALQFEPALSGVYDIYVGTFGGDTAPARLNISEFMAPSD